MQTVDWIVLVYKIPSEPTKYRAAVWREIKRLGGVYLQNSVAIFPDIDDVALNVSSLSAQIRNMDGSEYMFFTQSPTRGQADELIALFQSARSEEYQELLAEISELKEILQSIRTKEDTQFLLDRTKRLKKQIGIIKARDYFRASAGKQAGDEIQKLQEAVYAVQEGGSLM